MSKAKYKVPFDKDGNLMRYANPDMPSSFYYGAAEWRENVEFEAVMKVVATQQSRGVYCVLQDKDGHKYPMSASDFMTMLPHVNIFAGEIDGKHIWKARKCGRNYYFLRFIR